MLMNYQIALMKPYFDAGLKSMAEAAKYPVAAIQTCSQFKRTHYFILEAWEAVYRAMLSTYSKSLVADRPLSLDTHSEPLTQDPLLDTITRELSVLHQSHKMIKHLPKNSMLQYQPSVP